MATIYGKIKYYTPSDTATRSTPMTASPNGNDVIFGTSLHGHDLRARRQRRAEGRWRRRQALRRQRHRHRGLWRQQCRRAGQPEGRKGSGGTASSTSSTRSRTSAARPTTTSWKATRTPMRFTARPATTCSRAAAAPTSSSAAPATTRSTATAIGDMLDGGTGIDDTAYFAGAPERRLRRSGRAATTRATITKPRGAGHARITSSVSSTC